MTKSIDWKNCVNETRTFQGEDVANGWIQCLIDSQSDCHPATTLSRK